MTQFYATLPEYGALGPSVYGLDLSWVSNTTLGVTSGSCTDSTGVMTINVPANVVINAAGNGVNGLDTGTLAASTLYAVFAIGDPSNANPGATLLSLSATAPLLPAGQIAPNNYGTFRRIGWVLTDGASHFLKFYQEPTNTTRRYMQYDAPISVLSAGASTAYAAISLGTCVPSTFGQVVLYSALTPNAAGDIAFFRPTGATADWMKQIGQVTTVPTSVQFEILPLVSAGVPKVDYKVTAGTDAVSVSVLGYFDLL